jgi:hypothetical protein
LESLNGDISDEDEEDLMGDLDGEDSSFEGVSGSSPKLKRGKSN